MKKISIIIFLMICLSLLLLTGCQQVGITPEINNGNLEYQGDANGTENASNINIDKTPPVVTITLPGTGEYVLNQSVVAIWSATDDLSGAVSPVSGTILIDTSSEGTKTFTLPAGTVTDKAGNSSLIVTKSYSVIEDPEEPETEESQKWSGLGMNIFPSENSYINTVLDNGFTEVRHLVYYNNAGWVADSKVKVISWVAKGAKVIWGVAAPAPITSTNWSDYRAAILNAAAWAEDNGVYEFQLGNEEESRVDGTTMTVDQLIANLKSVATEVKEIYTRGNVSYACEHDQSKQVAWNIAGLGDIDLISFNTYVESTSNWDWWKTKINWMVNHFGARAYLSEFNLTSSSLDAWSADEKVQAEALTEMIEYIKDSETKRALYFAWKDGETSLGVLKADGTYRQLWNQALLDIEPEKSTTAIASAKSDMIALLAK